MIKKILDLITQQFNKHDDNETDHQLSQHSTKIENRTNKLNEKIAQLESENKALKEENKKIISDLQECKQMLQTLMNKQNAQPTE